MDQLNFFNTLRGDGTMVPNKEGKGSPVYMAADYSFAAEDMGKLNYRIAGLG